MRLLYLTSTGFDTPSANNHLAESFLGAMLDSGIDVHLVAGRRSGEDSDVPASLAERPHFTTAIVQRGTVDKTKMMPRIANELRFAFRTIRALRNERNKVDVALVQSSPLGLLHVFLLKSILRVPVVFSAYEIIPDYASAIMRRKLGPFYYLYRQVQKLTYTMSEKIITASEDMRNTLLSKGVPARKVAVVPNWYNDSLVYDVPLTKNHFIASNKIEKNKFIIQYAGTVGYVFDVDYFLNVADAFRADLDVEFHIIGEGTRKEELIRRALEMGLTNMRFFPWQPLELMSDVCSACDVCLVPLAEGTIFCAYPSKSSMLMACGRPAIYSLERDSCFAKEIEMERVGIVVERGSVEETVEAIRDLKDDPISISEMAHRGQVYAKDHLSASILAPMFVRTCCEGIVYRTR